LPGLSYLAIAEEDGEILATACVHLQLHIDHFWMSPANKALIDSRKLWNLLENRFPHPLPGLRVYAAPTFGNGEQLVEHLGFHRPEVPVMVKEY